MLCCAADLAARAAALRPKLHRYVARMIGSALDAEDVVQETCVRALRLDDDDVAAITNGDAWLMRAAHNLALDHLRRRAVRAGEEGVADMDNVPDLRDELGRRQATAAALAVFMRLPSSQRSAVILIDVLEHTAADAAAVLDTTVEALKSALQRGRANLRRWAGMPEPAPTQLDPIVRSRLTDYIDRFNAGDFAGLQDLLHDDVVIDLVQRTHLRGSGARPYFSRYQAAERWVASVGSVEGRPAVLLRRPYDAAGVVRSFALPTWDGDRIVAIRDYLFAPEVVESARTETHPPHPKG